MLSMSINHPDIEEFITKKQDLTKVTGANISVKVTDEFMQAVIKDRDYVLRYPTNSIVGYQNADGVKILHYISDNSFPNNISTYTTPAEYNKLYKVGDGYLKLVKARELWNTLMHCAHRTAEPGIMFEGAMHNYSPDGVYPDFKMIGTNPCGRQFCCK